MVAVACGAGDSASVSRAQPTTVVSNGTTTISTVSTPAPTEAPTPTPTPVAANRVGDTITTTNGNKIQLVKYAAPIDSGNPYITPPPGAFFAGIQVYICAGATKLSSFEVQFEAVEPDDTRISQTYLGDIPGKTGLTSDTIQPNQCVRGWVFFPMPVKPKAFVVTNSDLSWAVP